MEIPNTYTAFEGHKQIFKGSLDEVVLKVKKKMGKAEHSSILIFSDSTGKTMDFNFQGSEKDVLKRLDIFVSGADSKISLEAQGPGRGEESCRGFGALDRKDAGRTRLQSGLLEPDPRGRGSQYPAPTARHGDSSVRSGLQPVSLIAITRPPPHIFGRNSSKRRRVDPRILLRALARSCDPAAGSGSVAAHLISYLGYSSAQ